jgi:hypothetical protein
MAASITQRDYERGWTSWTSGITIDITGENKAEKDWNIQEI